MSIYDPLQHYLNTSEQSELQLSFPEIEAILGFNLPKSAYTHTQWWANGGHTQAKAWLSAGYKTHDLHIETQTVCFSRTQSPTKPTAASPKRTARPPAPVITRERTMTVCGYEFHFIQQLIPKCDNGIVKEYHPQKDYDNKDSRPLLYHGAGPFCRFTINAPTSCGVYLWVVNGEIIYIGETVNLQRRFNTGYGNIQPRNCYAGGQSTNCKMNKTVMEYYRRGTPIDLYFHQTQRYKQTELELLSRIHTKYNVKDN